MTTYLLSVHDVDGVEDPPADVIEEMSAAIDALNARLQKEGVWVFGGGLHPADTATVVDASKGGDVLTTDGPFAEAKEHIGGFWIVELPDLDAALELAAEASAACRAPVEVRPFQGVVDA